MSSGREGDVLRALVGLADSLVAGYDVAELLQRLVEHCTELLGITAAGLLLADAEGRLQVAAASSEQVRLLELLQVHGAAGPCTDAYLTRERVSAREPADLLRRWPAVAQLMGDAGYHGVAAVPLRLREQAIGALGLFGSAPGTPCDDDVDVAQALADIATIAVLQHRALRDSRAVNAQLQQALDSRVLIEQAKGVVAAQCGVDVAGAFQLIRSHARRHHLLLSDLAADLVHGRAGAGDLLPAAAHSPGHRSNLRPPTGPGSARPSPAPAVR